LKAAGSWLGWRVFHRTVQNIKERNADTDPNKLQRIIEEAAS